MFPIILTICSWNLGHPHFALPVLLPFTWNSYHLPAPLGGWTGGPSPIPHHHTCPSTACLPASVVVITAYHPNILLQAFMHRPSACMPAYSQDDSPAPTACLHITHTHAPLRLHFCSPTFPDVRTTRHWDDSLYAPVMSTTQVYY